MEKDKDKRTTDIIPDGITNGGIAASIKGGSPTGNTSVSLGTRSLERWLSEAKVMYSGMIYRFPQKRKPEEGSPRVRELFNLFMMYLETHFKDSRDVTYYASLLNITPKYLNIIAQRITGNTVKALINEYVVMQLKLSLCSGNTSMKMLAGEYNFSDLSFFCRYFKQHTGMTPMQFVKSEAPKRT